MENLLKRIAYVLIAVMAGVFYGISSLIYLVLAIIGHILFPLFIGCELLYDIIRWFGTGKKINVKVSTNIYDKYEESTIFGYITSLYWDDFFIPILKYLGKSANE